MWLARNEEANDALIPSSKARIRLLGADHLN